MAKFDGTASTPSKTNLTGIGFNEFRNLRTPSNCAVIPCRATSLYTEVISDKYTWRGCCCA